MVNFEKCFYFLVGIWFFLGKLIEWFIFFNLKMWIMKYRYVGCYGVNLYSYESGCFFFLSGVFLFRIFIEKCFNKERL